jgi:hypothetical protein
MKGTYTDGDYIPNVNGRVHTTFTFRPNNLQLSSRRPNIQNYPVHSKLAERFKGCIEAQEGHVIVSFDFRGFHNKMLGFLAKDDLYLRVASLDTHSFVVGYVVNDARILNCLELSDEELSIILKDIKHKHHYLRDRQIKNVVHGINYGLSEEGCYKRYAEQFNPSIEEVYRNSRKIYTGETLAKRVEFLGKQKVKNVYNIVKKLFPRVFEWQDRTIVEADKQGYIQIPFGARRWFLAASDIKYNTKGGVASIKKGEQAQEALAFPVSSNSHCHMRERMILIHKEGLDREANLINCIHDSLVFEIEDTRIEELCKPIKEILEARSSVLFNDLMPDGFFCNVDGKIGKTMRTYNDDISKGELCLDGMKELKL